jgi:hypothetical protein
MSSSSSGTHMEWSLQLGLYLRAVQEIRLYRFEQQRYQRCRCSSKCRAAGSSPVHVTQARAARRQAAATSRPSSSSSSSSKGDASGRRPANWI